MTNFKLSTVSVDKNESCSFFDKQLSFHSHDVRIQILAELYHQSKLLNIECHLGQSIAFVGRPDAILKVLGKCYLIDCCLKLTSDRKAVNQLTKFLRLGHPIFILYTVEHIPKLLHSLLSDIKFGNETHVFDEDYQDFIAC